MKRVSGDWPRWQRHAAMARPSPCRQAVRHKFPRGNCPVGQRAKPHFESKATSHCLRTLRSGPAPGPGRRVSRSADRHIATRRFSGGRPSSERHVDVHSIRRKEATRRRNKDGDGRTVRSGEIKANAGHVRRNSDHARPDAMAVTRRPFARGAGQQLGRPPKVRARMEDRSTPSAARSGSSAPRSTAVKVAVMAGRTFGARGPGTTPLPPASLVRPAALPGCCTVP